MAYIPVVIFLILLLPGHILAKDKEYKPKADWNPPKVRTTPNVLAAIKNFIDNSEIRIFADIVKVGPPLAGALYNDELGFNLKTAKVMKGCVKVIPMTELKKEGIELITLNKLLKKVAKKAPKYLKKYVKKFVKEAKENAVEIVSSEPFGDFDPVKLNAEAFTQDVMIVNKHRVPLVATVYGISAKFSTSITVGPKTEIGIKLLKYVTRPPTPEEVTEFYTGVQNGTDLKVNVTLDPTSSMDCVYMREQIGIGNPIVKFKGGETCQLDIGGRRNLPVSDNYHHYHRRGYTRQFDLNPLLKEYPWVPPLQSWPEGDHIYENKDTHFDFRRLDLIQSIEIPVYVGVQAKGVGPVTKHSRLRESKILPDYFYRTEEETNSMMPEDLDLEKVEIDPNTTDLLIRFSSNSCPEEIYEFKVHRLVFLARTGKHLQDLVLVNKSEIVMEGPLQVISLQEDFSHLAFEQVLDFIYTDEFPTVFDYKDILLASSKLGVDRLTEYILKTISDSFTPYNVVNYIDFAMKNNISALQDLGLLYLNNEAPKMDANTFMNVINEHASLYC